MSFDEWLAHDPAQDDKMCECCGEQVGEEMYDREWVCSGCREVAEENKELEEQESK